ncbi:MAG: BlaI/MecI/CopY family transcriptional regulator [Gemmatimonadaceae bacterium]
MTKSRKKEILKEDTLRLQDTVRLSAAGAGMLLGDLEHRILKAAWSLNRPVTARELHERVARTHNVVYITSVTVANRLVVKGILRRVKHDDLYHYTATLSHAEFSERASRHVVQRIVDLGSTAVSASLVDVLAERDPEQLAELGRLVRRKLREAVKDGD